MRLQIVTPDSVSKVFSDKREYMAFVCRLRANKTPYYVRNINNALGRANKDRKW